MDWFIFSVRVFNYWFMFSVRVFYWFISLYPALIYMIIFNKSNLFSDLHVP